MRTCPKCSYVRRPTDAAPAWQCPRCGVAYDKALGSAALASRARERAELELRAERAKRPAGVWPWLFLLLAAGSLATWGYTRWRAAHPTAAQRAAMAQADARLAEISSARKDLELAADLKTAQEHLRMARPKQGMEILQRRASEGHPRAMTALAVAYQGYGHAPVDLALSRQWMQRAAEEGSLSAYVHLGYASETGRGVPGNAEEAANLYRKAARQGDASGLYARRASRRTRCSRACCSSWPRARTRRRRSRTTSP